MGPPYRLFVGGRSVTCVALQLPEAHLGFWRSLEEQELSSMARCLKRNDNRQVPSGVDAGPAVWGEAPSVCVDGFDLGEELTVSLWDDRNEVADEQAPDAIEELTQRFTNPYSKTKFIRATGRSFLLYGEYRKAGSFHALGNTKPFVAADLLVSIYRFPNLASRGLQAEHQILQMSYNGCPLHPIADYCHDRGCFAQIVDF